MKEDLYEAVLDVLSRDQAEQLKHWLENVIDSHDLSTQGRLNIMDACERIQLDQWKK